MLITITGPTGSGKTTLARALLGLGITIVPTWTTRQLRGDEAGRSEITHVPAHAMRPTDMLELVTYAGYEYGTPASETVIKALRGECHAVKILEPKGLSALRDNAMSSAFTDQYLLGQPPALAHVFITAKPETLQRRLMSRCGYTPSPKDLYRMSCALEEARTWPGLQAWSHVIDNSEDRDDLQGHAEQLLASLSIPTTTPCRVHSNAEEAM